MKRYCSGMFLKARVLNVYKNNSGSFSSISLLAFASKGPASCVRLLSCFHFRSNTFLVYMNCQFTLVEPTNINKASTKKERGPRAPHPHPSAPPPARVTAGRWWGFRKTELRDGLVFLFLTKAFCYCSERQLKTSPGGLQQLQSSAFRHLDNTVAFSLVFCFLTTGIRKYQTDVASCIG